MTFLFKSSKLKYNEKSDFFTFGGTNFIIDNM